jgi:hypothetical protein
MLAYDNLTDEEKIEFSEATEKKNEAYYAFCEKIITLSTGFLALTITFRNSFVSPNPSLPFLLFLSWICFAVAILTSTYIHWGKAWIYKRRAQEILERKSGTGILPKCFTIIRYIMFISFPTAIASFVSFVIINKI